MRFSMAVETGRKDENGNRIAQFVSISVFGKQGNTILQYFHKGNRIACHVRNLEARAYTDKANQPQASLNAVLTGVEFVETKVGTGTIGAATCCRTADGDGGGLFCPAAADSCRTACTDSSTTDAAGHEYCCPGHRSVGGLILCLICGVTRRI